MAEFFNTNAIVATGKEMAVMGAGTIAGAKWLDRNVFFAKEIAAHPEFVNTFKYKHWGGIVALVAAWAATSEMTASLTKEWWIKLALVGIGNYGLLVEARQDFGVDPDSMPPNQPRWGMMGAGDESQNAQLEELNNKLKELAMSGTDMPMGDNNDITNRFSGGVGNNDITNRYSTGVGFRRDIPMGNIGAI